MYIGGTLILILDIYVAYLILTTGGDVNKKLLWLILVLIFPPVGAILYLLLGRSGKLS